MSKKYITDVIKIDGQLLDGNGSAGTSGQVLSSTGTATDWVSLSEISGVDGSGTANYLAKWADGDSITNSVIYDNGTNVGIGTTSPNPHNWGHRALTVQATGENKYSALEAYGTGTGSGAVLFGADSIMHSSVQSVNGSHLAFTTNATNSGISQTERMRIKSNGYV